MTTLALNMIVAPGESGLLKRCLDSFHARDVFDEIVIVNTSNDSNINVMAQQYDARVFNFAWETEQYPYGDFGGARNLAVDKSTADNIMWLDTDDALLPRDWPGFEKALALVKSPERADIEQWSVSYALVCDETGKPQMAFWRERIFKRELCRWKRPVHETLTPEWELVKNAKINGIFITHLPMKPSYTSATRNVKILEHEYKNNTDDVQVKYFLGRDLMFIGRINEGVKILSEIVDNLETGTEMMYSISMELVWYFAYGRMKPRPMVEELNVKNIGKVEGWCRQALSFTSSYAEPYLVLGDVYWHGGFLDSAMKMYMLASKKKVGQGKFQLFPFYNELPADRLSKVFEMKGNYDLACHFNHVAMNYNNIGDHRERRKYIIEKLAEEYNNVISKN